MILQLHNKTITIKDSAPERVDKVRIKYEFELGTNHLFPILYVENKVYKGDNIYITFDYNKPLIDLKVDLVNGRNEIVRSYNATYPLYRTFILGNYEVINVYKELVQAKERIQQLEEEGDVI